MNTDGVMGNIKNKTIVRYSVGAVVVFLLGWMLWPSESDESEDPFFEVQKGPLTININESGSIQSRERVIVKSEVEGRTTILWLIEEGVHVEEGDLLVELDASNLEDAKEEQQISVLNTEAAFIRSRETLEITRNQSGADISKAELDYRFAQLALTKYEEGEYPQELQSAEADITLAREELQRAGDKLAWSTKLADEGYITRMELQADELAERRARIDLELAEGKLEVLQAYTHVQRLEELKSDVDQKRLALERITLRASADMVQAEADLSARQSEHERQRERLEKLNQQILKCKIYAPAAGMVVYVSSGGGRRSIDEPLREGQEVRERQDLIYLPTAAAMMADVRIHESALRKVQLGQEARVTVDALPGRVFEGRVARIAVLPDSQHGWLNPDIKVYQTEVYLEGAGSELRPGMNCRADIIIEEYEDVLYVPLQSVIQENGQTVVYVPGSSGPEPRTVEVGMDNNRMIHILSGLDEGMRVLLSPPLRASRVPEGRGAGAS